MEPEQLYQWVKDHKEDIVAGAQDGDNTCLNIIRVYRMLVAFPEQCALGLLQGLVDEYIQRAAQKLTKPLP